MEKQTPPNNAKRPLPSVAHWVLAGVALGCSYLAISVAIDTGSLVSYAAALLLLVLGVKHLVQGAKAGKGRAK